MATLGLIEGIARSVKAQLEARCATARARVETDLGLAANTIPDVAEFGLGMHTNHASYPSVDVESANHRVLTDAPDYMKSAFVVPIVVTVTAPIAGTGDPEENLQVLVWRYERIVIDAILAARAAGAFASGGVGFGVDLQDEDIDYSPTRVIAGDLYARDIFIPAICTIEEARS